jgi:hypothetical protein
MVRLRIMLATGVVLAAGLVPVVAVAPAGASSGVVTTTQAPLGTAMTVTFMMANGNNYSPGQPNPVAGNPIVQTTSPGRFFIFSNSIMVGSYHGGTLQLMTNGNYMAANDACTGVTIKSDRTSPGTAWYIIPGNNGTIQLANRNCTNPLDDTPVVIYGDDVLNDQWKFCESGPGEGSQCGPGEFYNLLETEYV